MPNGLTKRHLLSLHRIEGKLLKRTSRREKAQTSPIPRRFFQLTLAAVSPRSVYGPRDGAESGRGDPDYPVGSASHPP